MSPSEAIDVRLLRVEIVRGFSHDPAAFTQGLIWHEGKLYESTGRRGESTVRRIDPASGLVETRVRLGARYFGEGLERVGSKLYQLTYQEETGFVYDLPALTRRSTFSYRGEGWGLCYDGRRFLMSDGSDRLSFRDVDDFSEIDSVAVTFRGMPLGDLNELECVGNRVYANVWQRSFIVEIDPSSGRVVSQIDATGLLSRADLIGADVLNGIAYNPRDDTFFLTGKLWPRMFEVRFVPR